ncbi:MAG: DUF1302 family protein [Pseudomonadota bacterium]
MKKILQGLFAGVNVLALAAPVHAVNLTSGGDWDASLDTTLQYTNGWRLQKRDDGIGNHPFYAEGDYKFDKGDRVTNRLQGIVELQAVYKKNTALRISGSYWNDWAYDDSVKTNPNPAFSTFLSYPGGRYSDVTKKYAIRGGEILDAFVSHNDRIGEVPVYAKAGRFTQYWGNAFFFGFSNIAYSQHPVDYGKAFTQPGSEIKELFLPRKQVMLTADLAPNLSISAQYFAEFRENRFPEGGTYLGPFDILYSGPTSGGALAGSFGGPVSAGTVLRPSDNNGNFGVKVAWAPKEAGGDLGFYFRQFDDVQPWASADIGAAGGGAIHQVFAQKSQLFGLSYERTFGPFSTGFELSYRKKTALNSAFTNGMPGVPYTAGATGDITNVIANLLYPLPQTPLWDTGVFIGELSYTHLNRVTGNKQLFNGVGYASCTNSVNPALPGALGDGCATKNALALAFLAEPQWLQVLPGVDFSTPVSLTYGAHGNPAYVGGPFYAKGTRLFSIGVKATVQQKTTVLLQYNGYHYDTSPKAAIPGLGSSYAGFGGNGAVALNDKGWIQLTVKTSF